MGKPVVATSIPGYASVVTHGDDGLLVPPCNYQELAQALLTLLKDEKLRQQMGAKGKVKSKDYDWKVVSSKLMDFYQRTIDRVRGSSSQ